MTRMFAAAFSGLSALLLAACAPQPVLDAAPQAGAGPRPALWRIADADTEIHLFGTIHALPEGLEWRTGALDAALERAEELVMELVPPEDPAAIAAVMMRMGMAQGLPPILDRVSPDKRDALRDQIAASGVPIQAFDAMKSWTAALILTAISFQRMGIEAERGVEQVLTEVHRGRARAFVGLETAEQQFGYFDGLSEEAQRLLLDSVAEDPEEGREQFEAMLAAWASGDVDAIAATFDSETVLSPELRGVLMRQRNQAWADWLVERMRRPGRVFVAVGAGHLAGEDSVQNMLAARGVRVQRVQ